MMPTIPTTDMPKQDEENELLRVLDDYLHNGGKIPSDADTGFMLRLILGGVRTTYRQSARNSNSLRSVWIALAVVFVSMGASILITAETHAHIWDAITLLRRSLP